MKERSLTRRHFVAGCAGLGAIAACGLVPTVAFGEGGQIGASARPEWDSIHTICRACPNACGLTAYTSDGKLGKTIGDAFNPNSAGNLCARGYGYTQSAFSDAKPKNPMRRKDNGEFQTISWDEAFAEIGEKIMDLAEENPNSVAMIYDGVLPNARNYSNIFMNGLGSGNSYVDDLTIDVVKSSAFKQIIGVDSYYPDIDNADFVFLIDTSFTDISTPNLSASLQAARERGAKIVSLDPRLGTLGSFADDWYAANPGSELAVLLAVCRQIIANGRYDKAYATSSISGFDLWAKAIEPYTAQWAQDISGIENFKIDQLASYLEQAAPKVAILYGNGSVPGISYTNSVQTAKVVCMLNAILGAWGAEGGALLPFDYEAAFAGFGLEAMPGSENEALGGGAQGANLIAPEGIGAAVAMDYVARSQIKGLITLNADVAYDYSSVANFDEAAKGLDLLVCVTDEMTQTALDADYILPLSSYLSTATDPECLQGSIAGMAMSSAVIEPADGDNSLPLGVIMDGLAEVCGLDDLISVQVAEGALERLGAFGLDVEALAQNGSAEVEASKVERMTLWPTASGMIECVDVNAPVDEMLPIWVEPVGKSNIVAVISDDMNFGQKNDVAAVLSDGQTPVFHLITGSQSVIGMHGYNVAELTDISKKYQLDSVWINSDVAKLYGIETGDKVVLHNDLYSAEAEAFVTGRIAPSAVYLPISFGRTSSKQKNACNVGINPMLFSEAILNDEGALCIQEACVGIDFVKEGA